jgi:hypothetical protein
MICNPTATAHLASALTSLGVRFQSWGRPGEALPVNQEAVSICQELAAVNPDRYRSDLAQPLTPTLQLFWTRLAGLLAWFRQCGRSALWDRPVVPRRTGVP